MKVQKMNFNIPVLFIIFNRPDTTKKVFERISKVRPKTLFIAADGARPEKCGEDEKCKKCREIVNLIDWDCNVFTDFSDQNLGCKKRVSSAITWAFSKVDKLIIIEDDVLPGDGFFEYMEELLLRYANDNRIMMVSGANIGLSEFEECASYGFSRFAYIWGWGTWKRAWRLYDVDVTLWPEAEKKCMLERYFYDSYVVNEYRKYFQMVHNGGIDTWDYQWVFCLLSNSGLCIVPKYNLITNIGFGKEATHTFNEDDPMGNLKIVPMQFPLVHPKMYFPMDVYKKQSFSDKSKRLFKHILTKTGIYSAIKLFRS